MVQRESRHPRLRVLGASTPCEGSSVSHVINRGGMAIDHIALAFHDHTGGRRLRQRSDRDRCPASRPATKRMVLERKRLARPRKASRILGPNPDVPPNNPFANLLPQLAEPQLIFWYVGVTDLDGFLGDLQRSGRSALEVTQVTDPPPGHPAYKRGIIGPDYDFVCPMFIEWIYTPELTSGVDAGDRGLHDRDPGTRMNSATCSPTSASSKTSSADPTASFG